VWLEPGPRAQHAAALLHTAGLHADRQRLCRKPGGVLDLAAGSLDLGEVGHPQRPAAAPRRPGRKRCREGLFSLVQVAAACEDDPAVVQVAGYIHAGKPCPCSGGARLGLFKCPKCSHVLASWAAASASASAAHRLLGCWGLGGVPPAGHGELHSVGGGLLVQRTVRLT